MPNSVRSLRRGVAYLILTAGLGIVPPESGSPFTPAPAPHQVPVAIVRAGSSHADITPPPGFETGGHGPGGTTGRGYWGTLRATAFYFEDSAGRASVLVSCDLFAIPSRLHQKVARHFASARNGVAALPLERIVLAANHTHQGPGNFLSVEAHNKHGSKTGGYDSRLRKFLLRQIIAAIEGAAADAHAHTDFQLDIVVGTLPPSLFRNRSPAVFMGNRDHATLLAAFGSGLPTTATECLAARQKGEPTEHWNIEECPRLRAVDRRVSLLRIRRDGRTAAMAVFVAVHPTVLPAKTPLLSPDVFGIARAALEEADADPIGRVGFFNGAEGDITMRRTTRNAVDMLESGRSLAAEIRTIHDATPGRPVGAGEGIHGRLHFAAPGDVLTTPAGHRVRLARTALGGVAALGGAEDDRLFLYKLGFREGHTRKPRGEHGVKVPALWILTGWKFPQHIFPTRLPMSIVRIGDLTLAVVPFEMSTAVGYAIHKALERERGHLEIVGLANEYGSYTATADEYGAQDYMGASTLWGPEQAAFIVESLGRLYSELDGTTGSPAADDPGKPKQFGPHRLSKSREKIFKDLEPLASLEGSAARPPFFYWCEAEPPPLPAHTGRDVEVIREDGTVADRMGVAVVIDGRPRKGRSRWAAIWLSPPEAPHTARFRFRVVASGQTVLSDLFEVPSSPPPDCPKLP